jgi:HEPN domain-containing protein
MNEKIEYWISLADYDLETAKALLKAKRFLYVGFMCHQVVEKAIKGFYVLANNETPPYSHNLKVLAKECTLYDKMAPNQMDFLSSLSPLNIESRYPIDKERLLKTLDRVKCHQLLAETEELLKWIKVQLLSS